MSDREYQIWAGLESGKSITFKKRWPLNQAVARVKRLERMCPTTDFKVVPVVVVLPDPDEMRERLEPFGVECDW